LKNKNISVNCLHPGVINTKLLKAGWGPVGSPVEVGSENVLWVALSNNVGGISGKYFVNKKPAPYAKVADDKLVRTKLWKISEKLTGVTF